MITEQFILYNNFKHCDILEGVCRLKGKSLSDEERQDAVNDVVRQLLKMTAQYGFRGNLWHTYIAFLIVNNENPYSLACEVRGEVEGSINIAAQHDFELFIELFDYDKTVLEGNITPELFDIISNFEDFGLESLVFNKHIRDQICNLSKNLKNAATVDEFQKLVSAFYGKYGVGEIGLHKAFRIENAKIVPISNIAQVTLDDIVGYDAAKKKIIDNTEAFVQKRPANNCLLYGAAGTGKSTSIKAIANMYYDKGLRLIEVYKHQFKELFDVIAQIKNRNYRFIIYMDDLSFEEFEIEYKYLKAVIEGGLEKKPENVLIYATSNRRHLVREKFSDKKDRDDDLHSSDTVQEKLSLGARFGMQIYFGVPDKKEFNEIVCTLADKYNIAMSQDELLLEANKWELSHGGLSGRSAQQFIDYLRGNSE